MTRPVIGVTTSHERGWWAWQFHRFAIWRAGGVAKRLTAERVRNPAQCLAKLDGLIIGGGDDISATLYDGSLDLEIRTDPKRDALEMALLSASEGSDLPVLGVCRGAQMLALWRGGSLIRDIYDHFGGLPRLRTVLPRLRIILAQPSLLSEILNRAQLRVNALHHQSIDHPGTTMRIVARDRYGVTQAIEHTGERFLIGVQWHPEFLPQKQSQQRLFQALIASANANRK